MSIEECIEFANKNPVCYIATVDGDQPRVRGFLMWYADKNGFFFTTRTNKNVCNQLRINPKVEVCFFSDNGVGKMMRVTGMVKFIDDISVKARAIEERPFLKKMGIKAEDPLFSVFQIYTGDTYVWSMDSEMREIETDKVKF